MWIFSFIPDAFLYYAIFGVIALGVVLYIIGAFTSLIPPIKPYADIIKSIAVVTVIAGFYFLGGYGTEIEWRKRVEDMQAKVVKAEEQSKKANTKLDSKAQEKIKVIREKGLVVKQYIDREVTKYDNSCVIPKEFVKAHNKSAEALNENK